ncbi:MAG: hypothetical protein K8R69_12185 [Deltaproteobacteria bacterium]|nr:hypothetical protein [Deltaproteobacteria bacterium]
MQDTTGIETGFPHTVHFDLGAELALKSTEIRAATDPIALLTLADWALAGDFEAEAALLGLSADRNAYLEALLENGLLLPQLAVLADLGCSNIQGLLADLVISGPEEFFFLIAGTAAEGCRSSFALLNETATLSHVARLVEYGETYRDDPLYGDMLTRVIASTEFFPKILDVALSGDSEAASLVSRLAELGNPFAQEWVYVPRAVGFH